MPDLDPARMRYVESRARTIARTLDRQINNGQREKYGFALLVFSFTGPEMTWISNAERESMIKALEELLERWKTGRSNDFPGGIDARN